MSVRLEQHMQRLWLLWAAMLASTGVYSLVVLLLGEPARAPRGGGEVLAWVLGPLSAANLATIAPVLHTMLATARRSFAAGERPERAMSAHLAALVTAWARVEAVAVCGLALYFVSGRTDIFWAFLAVSTAALLILRPTPPPTTDPETEISPSPTSPVVL